RPRRRRPEAVRRARHARPPAGAGDLRHRQGRGRSADLQRPVPGDQARERGDRGAAEAVADGAAPGRARAAFVAGRPPGLWTAHIPLLSEEAPVSPFLRPLVLVLGLLVPAAPVHAAALDPD